MINLLIDNCSLLRIVNENGYNTFLVKLEDLINARNIKFFTHELIIEEWNKHKDNKIRRIARKASADNIVNVDDEILLHTNDLYKHLYYQKEKIDELLAKAELLKTPQIIKDEFSERYRKKLAPFHSKRDSQNDWEIIGTLCHFCENNNIEEIFFISHNHNEFADTIEIDRTIHPDLQNRFNKVKINYFREYYDFFHEFDSLYDSSTSILNFNIPINNKFTFKATIKDSALNSLDYIFNTLYSEISFIPIHILTRYFPFAKDEKSTTWHNLFSLNNTHEKFIEFLKTFTIENNNLIIDDKSIYGPIDKYRDRVENILLNLNNNFIDKVSNDSHEKEINIFFRKEKTCNCARCSFNVFNYYLSLKDLQTYSDNLKDKTLKAYIQYKIGNLKASCDLYIEVAEEAKNKKQYITYFIAKYNLKHLGIFLNNRFYNEEVDEALIEYLKRIDPIEEAVKLKSLTDYSLLLFIAQEDYFTQAFQEISKIVNDILEHYNSNLKGGWSHNHNVWKLYEEFAKLYSFINQNFIIYDRFSNFDNLFDSVTEGLFASHSIKESGGARLESFDNYWIHKLLIYGKKKSIIKYFNKYNLECLVYVESQDENNYFIEMSKNFFQNQDNYDEIKNLTQNNNNLYYDYNYNVVFENFILLASILNLNDKSLNYFAELLLVFLERQTIINNSSIETIEIFFNNKGKRINESCLYGYFKIFNKGSIKRNYEIIKSIITSFDKSNSLDLPIDTIFDLINLSYQYQEYSRYSYPALIVSLFQRVDVKKKEYIRKTIKKRLKNNFDFNLYYMGIIFHIIRFNKVYFLELINKYQPKPKESFYSIFTGMSDYSDYYLSQLINVIFKYNIDIGSENKIKIKNVNPYYNWLIDMENFDYGNFNAEWVYNFKTKYYYRRISKSKKTLNALIKYAKENPNSEITNIIMQIKFFK